MRDQYQAWARAEMVEKFDCKRRGDFFESERRILSEIGSRIDSVLDIGCASGRFIELLEDFAPAASFTGVDITASNIERARANYPGATFHHGNILDLDLQHSFDLVNATGVMQHEPQHHDVIQRMIGWSNRYVMFDVKLAAIDDDLVDIDRAYSRIGEDRLYFIVLAWPRLRDRLMALPGLARISVSGYQTPRNANTVLPDGIEPLVSAGILIALGAAPGAPTLEFDLPHFIEESV